MIMIADHDADDIASFLKRVYTHDPQEQERLVELIRDLEVHHAD